MFDFPAAPVIGQEYLAAGATYRWNGYGWALVAIVPAAADPVAKTKPDTATSSKKG